MSIESKDFACKKISTTIGKSLVLINEEHKIQASPGMVWEFILPHKCKIKANVTQVGGNITFTLTD